MSTWEGSKGREGSKGGERKGINTEIESGTGKYHRDLMVGCTWVLTL